ncbi:MAG: PDZ domain-containing protein [Bacillota bacterium]
MRPFLDLGLAILRVLPSALFEPTYAIAFWLVVLLVFFQYRRVAGMEERLYGFVKNQPGHQTILAAAQGLVGGLIGSFILVFVGVSLSGAGIQYLLPVALLLYVLSPRLMCFSYAGGIVAVLYLLFGFPPVSVGGIMALVGILHLTESLLIWLSGHTCATPVVIRNQRRELVGAFSLQKFWPVPIVVLVLLAVPDPSQLGGLIEMPDWWPLLRADRLVNPDTAVYALLPVMAAVGYAEVAITDLPRQVSRRTAVRLAGYSVALLVLAVAASRAAWMEWPAALFGPLGHEVVVRRSLRREMRGEPWLRPTGAGVRILDVMPGSPASQMGLGPGDTLLAINGEPVHAGHHIHEILGQPYLWLELTVRRPDGQLQRLVWRGQVERLGIIPLPGPGEATEAQVRPARSPLLQLLEGWWRRLHSRR